MIQLTDYSLSYSTLADIYALAEEADDYSKKALLQMATDLEQTGIGYYNGEEYWHKDTPYGLEVISVTDLASEEDDDGEE